MSHEDMTADQAAHVLVDDRAARRYEDEVLYAGPSSVTDAERQAIRRVLDARCAAGGVMERLDAFVESRQSDFFASGRQDWRLAAASGRGTEPTAEAEEDIRFVFVSESLASVERAWRAELVFPGVATGSSMLGLKVLESDGTAAGNGLFTIAGTTLVVERGCAEIPRDLFLVGIRHSAIAFQREGDVAVPGNLVFF